MELDPIKTQSDVSPQMPTEEYGPKLSRYTSAPASTTARTRKAYSQILNSS